MPVKYLVPLITQTKVTYQSIWIKISKKDDTDFKITLKSENFILSAAIADTKHTMENRCHAFYQFTVRFMKLSSPLGTKLRGF